MSKAGELRKLLASGKLVKAPGCFDSLSAILVESMGFPATAVSGFAVAATFGYPDVGLTTMSEVVSRVARIVDSVKIPVIADADTGYGGMINVTRTVREFDRVGVAAIHLEDQEFPKKCGSMPGKQLVSKQEMIARLRAAVDERGDSDLILIARTDALGVTGLDDAIERGKAYAKAGADVLFLHGPRSLEEISRFCEAVEVPAMMSLGETTRWVRNQRIWSADEVAKAGMSLVVYATGLIYAAAKAMKDTLAEIREKGTTDGILDRMMHFKELTTLLGLQSVYEKEAKYAVRPEEV